MYMINTNIYALQIVMNSVLPLTVTKYYMVCIQVDCGAGLLSAWGC